MRIIGIDPGTAILGYGILDYRGNRFRVETYGCIRTPAHTPQPARLHTIFQELTRLVQEYRPDTMAVEQLFFNTNVTTAIAVGQARGVVLLTAQMNGLPVGEYTPMQVKQAVTGYGSADKRQVQEMVRRILGLRDIPRPDDAADALAVGICHAHSAGTLSALCEGDL